MLGHRHFRGQFLLGVGGCRRSGSRRRYWGWTVALTIDFWNSLVGGRRSRSRGGLWWVRTFLTASTTQTTTSTFAFPSFSMLWQCCLHWGCWNHYWWGGFFASITTVTVRNSFLFLFHTFSWRNGVSQLRSSFLECFLVRSVNASQKVFLLRY